MSQVITANEMITIGSGIVCLCGSTKFFFETMEANRRLTYENWVVLQCGSWGHSFHKYSEEINRDFESIKKLHFHKILMSDLVCIITDDSNYMGSSTIAEVEFAQFRNIPVIQFNGKQFSNTVIPIYARQIPKEFQDHSLIESFQQQTGKSLGY